MSAACTPAATLPAALAPARRTGAVRGLSLVLACMLAMSAVGARAADAIRVRDHTHLGVASCASSVCHGKLSPQKDKDVWLNEYRIWSSQDLHAQAYRVLSNDRSKQIAAKLGLSNAATARICLDCHADNVPEDKRGPKFNITDGVGCEACHGGSGEWIESHTEPEATHADNLAKGMYPTEDPLSRASICLSCHLGTKDQFATHRIMGAGHPRLSFELDTFTANQPAHYSVDADYIKRKGQITDFRLWVTGQLESAQRYLELIGTDLFQPGGMFPELAFYDCQSCHHPMEDLRWSHAQAGPGIQPGAVRLQDAHLRTLAVITRELDGDAAASELTSATVALVRAGQTSAADTRARAAQLLDWIHKRAEAWSGRTLTRDQAVHLRVAILGEAAAGRMADFADAEQTFLAVESLSYFLKDEDAHGKQLDVLYKVVQDPQSYQPQSFRRAAAQARDGFR